MPDYIDQMDAIYAATLDEPATVGQCEAVALTMKTIADKCLKALERPDLSGELKMRLTKTRRMAFAEIDAARKEQDLLSHWPLMRDMLTVMPCPTR